jgi:hypothetical protein
VAVVVAALVVVYFAFFKGKSAKVVSEEVKEEYVDQAGVVHQKVTVRHNATP